MMNSLLNKKSKAINIMDKINNFIQRCSLIILLVSLTVYGAGNYKGKTVTIDGGKIVVEFDNNLRSRVISKLDKKETVLNKFCNSEYVTTGSKKTNDFKLNDFNVKDLTDQVGKGKEYEIIGISKNLKKIISIVSYNDFPSILFYKVTYQNTSRKNIIIDSWTNNDYSILSVKGKKNEPPFWSYQPGSYGWDNNWIMPLKVGFTRDNFLGMTSVDYGGGTPVADIWRRDCGIAVGHVEMVPKIVSLPVSMLNKDAAELSITYKKKIELKPGDKISTFRTFVEVHKGDHFNSLTVYREFMERQGITFKDAPADAYGTEWCGWGYEQNFTMEQMYNTLPKVKELGIDWVVLDMGWYKGMGDYYLPKDKFPNGEEDIIKFVKKVHSMGLKVQLWWMPLAVAPNTELMANHASYLLLNEDGSPQYMPSFFKSFFLCPASKEVQEYSKQLVTKFMKWGFDGLKIDGNNQNGVPLCYNQEHHHARAEESPEALPAFYRIVYETALGINPNAKIEICPCGTNQSFFLMPYMNETVASDPHGSLHVRIKAKVLRALTGPKAVFYGDHVELSDDRSDFASTIGVGGTIGTKFVYPPGIYMNTESGDVSLTPEKELIWKKWIGIYNANFLSKGKYRGELYDAGYDIPETHAIQKGNTMYYAFYGSKYDGSVELRGLEKRDYKVIDYENNIELGVIKGPVDKLKVNFGKHLLVKAEPI
jgi:alpha-galactosidase